MGVQGADLDGLGRLKSAFERQSGTLQAIMGGASTGVAALDQLWVGADAGQFRTTWTTVHQRALAAAMRALAEAADTVERNRRAQEAASAGDGAGAGGLGGLPSSAPPTLYQGAPSGGDPVPTARPVEEIFSEDYLNDFVGKRVKGENSPELNGLLEAVLADDGSDPARLQANLDRIADIRGVDRATFRAQYGTYQQLLAADAANGNGPPSIDLNRHGDFLGSTASLRYGSVVGDALGVDPVFGALLNPTGGLVGGGDDAYNPGENDAVGYHGIFHDAAGYLFNHQDIGPGYDYLGREGSDTRNPENGQIGGITWWVGNHPELDADLSEAAVVFGHGSDPRYEVPIRALHYLGAEELIGEAVIVSESGTEAVAGLNRLVHGDQSGFDQIADAGQNVVIGTADNAFDRAIKPIELDIDAAVVTVDATRTAVDAAVGVTHDVVDTAVDAVPGVVSDLADRVPDLGRPFTPLTGLFG